MLPGPLSWREAATHALYGPDGFYRRERPADHFRTSVHVSPLFAEAFAALLLAVDEDLGHPARLDVVDMGAGCGSLLRGVLALLPPDVRSRTNAVAVEVAPRPPEPGLTWATEPPTRITGLIMANEWLDNVPVDIAELTPDGPRLLLVTPDGTESPGPPLPPEDLTWLTTWWPLPHLEHDRSPEEQTAGRRAGLGWAAEGWADGRRPESARAGDERRAELGWAAEGWADGLAPGGEIGGLDGGRWRAEIGRSRGEAWAEVVGRLDSGIAVAVDYAHSLGDRRVTLMGYRDGRAVAAVPDGSCDLTCHVALDACAVPGLETILTTQRVALRAFGVSAERPPRELALTDPVGYVRALSRAGEAAELADPAGLGAFGWLIQAKGNVSLKSYGEAVSRAMP
ncbi:SAM-dependent methyltransferase [Actinocorallia lasiicapitis]